MLPSFALALAASTASLPQESADRGPELQVWDGTEFVTVLDRFDGTPAIVPLSTTVDVVTRAAITARGVRLRIAGGDAPVERWSARLVEHAPDDRVLLVDGELGLFGDAVLPVDVVALDDGRPALAELARQDGVGLDAGAYRLRLPDADRRLLALPLRTGPSSPAAATLGVEGAERDRDGGRSPRPLAPGRSSALALAPGGATELRIRSDRPLDALLVGRLAPLDAADAPLLAVETSDLDGEVSVRLSRELSVGRTATLLVTVDRPRALDPVAAPVAAPDAAPAPAPALVDVAGPRGLRLMHFEGPHEQLDIRPTMGPGAAWGDLNEDGRPDLYLVQGGGREGSLTPPNQLHVTDEGGFRERGREAGVGDTGWGMGAQFVDLDGDGALDLYLANYGADVLYRRDGVVADDGTPRFADVTAPAGVTGDRWSAGIAAADPDRDGDLDLYVTGYLVYDESAMPALEDLPLAREDPIEMLPFAFPGERNVFYRNESPPGAIRLVDATDALGLADEEGRGMQPVFFDFDTDGTQDLYVANDVSMNRLYRVDAAGAFTDIAFQTGMDDPRGGMGVAIGDVDGDLDEDLFLTNWQLEPNALYRNNVRSHASQRRRVASFRDVTVQAGFGTHGVGFTSWGAELFDLELDGDLDLFVANGYTSPDYETTGICVGQPNHLYLNDGEGRFRLAPEPAGPDVARALASRAVAACDYDRDGDVDLLVTANNGPVQLLENRAERPEGARWLGVGLRTGVDRNRFAIGALVTVEVDGRRFVRSLRAGTSYLAGNPPELHFGLGRVAGPATVTVDWPSGARSTHTVGTLSRWIVLEEPVR